MMFENDRKVFCLLDQGAIAVPVTWNAVLLITVEAGQSQLDHELGTCLQISQAYCAVSGALAEDDLIVLKLIVWW